MPLEKKTSSMGYPKFLTCFAAAKGLPGICAHFEGLK
jgi:hypothetical protein